MSLFLDAVDDERNTSPLLLRPSTVETQTLFSSLSRPARARARARFETLLLHLPASSIAAAVAAAEHQTREKTRARAFINI
jgi:hypothetical protein